MQRTFLSGKIHNATVTDANVNYIGSCAIDENFLNKAGIFENEQIDIYNVTTGERFTTYAIKAPRGSKTISVNGAAAHKAKPQDRIIICSYATIHEQEIPTHKPSILFLDQHNTIVTKKQFVPEDVI